MSLTRLELNNIMVIQKVALTKYRSAKYEFEREAIIRNAIYEAFVTYKIKEEGIQI